VLRAVARGGQWRPTSGHAMGARDRVQVRRLSSGAQRPVYLAGQGMVPITRRKGATIRSRRMCFFLHPCDRGTAVVLSTAWMFRQLFTRPPLWLCLPRCRDMGKSAISAAIADAGIDPSAVTALYVGNMLSGMLSNQQVRT